MMKKPEIHIINQQLEPLDSQKAPANMLLSGKDSLITQAVNSFLGNQRHAFGHAKTRGQVTGSTVKIYRQKGTGRARHGDRQAPIFVGGGKSHGPTGTQNYTRRLSGTMPRQAIYAVLSAKLTAEKMLVIDQLSFSQTSKAGSFFSQLRQKYAISKNIGYLTINKDPVLRYLRNLTGVDMLIIDSLNAYCLANCEFLLLSQAAYQMLTPKTTTTKDTK